MFEVVNQAAVARMGMQSKGPSAAASLLVVGVLVSTSGVAAESVVLGKGISNVYAGDVACARNEICLDSVFVWEFDATRTVSGPPVTGRVRAIIAAHGEATSKFVRSVELFVVRRIDEPGVREAYGAEYYLVSLSPRYERSRYCISVDARDLGLRIPSDEISVDETGYYCFLRRLVR
jgi:hypothetical protein